MPKYKKSKIRNDFALDSFKAKQSQPLIIDPDEAYKRALKFYGLSKFEIIDYHYRWLRCGTLQIKLLIVTLVYFKC